MAEIGLQCSGIDALIGQRVAAGNWIAWKFQVAEHAELLKRLDERRSLPLALALAHVVSTVRKTVSSKW